MSENSVRGSLPACSPDTAIKYTVISAFAAVAWYNVIELNVQVFLTFKRHRGLYFWSLIVSSWGIALHALGFILKFFVPSCPWEVYGVIIMIGWWSMVTGQSVVLWSRLHLVVRDNRILRVVLAMIVVDAVCLHIPTSVLTWGSYSPKPEFFSHKFAKMEKVQMTLFVCQETIISAIYVWATLGLLKPIYHGRTRKVLVHLVIINVVIICMDAVLLGMEFSNHYEIQAALKPMVYSIKLKLEFAVLNQLMVLANTGLTGAARSQGTHGPRGFASGSSVGGADDWDSATEKPQQRKMSKNDEWDYQQANKQLAAKANSNSRKKWLPSLDRNAIVKISDFEVKHEQSNGIDPAHGVIPSWAKDVDSAVTNEAHPGTNTLMAATNVQVPQEQVAHARPSVEEFSKQDASPSESEKRLNSAEDIQEAANDLNIPKDGHHTAFVGMPPQSIAEQSESKAGPKESPPKPGFLNPRENMMRAISGSSSEFQWPPSTKKDRDTGPKIQDIMGSSISAESSAHRNNSRGGRFERSEAPLDIGGLVAGRENSRSHSIPSSGGTSLTRVGSTSPTKWSHERKGSIKELGNSTSVSSSLPPVNASGVSITAGNGFKKIRDAAESAAQHVSSRATHQDGRPKGLGWERQGEAYGKEYDPGRLDPYGDFVGAGIGAGSRMGDKPVGAQPPAIPAAQNVYSRPRPVGTGQRNDSLGNMKADSVNYDTDDDPLKEYGARLPPRDEESQRF